MDSFTDIVDAVGKAMDGMGVLAILIGLFYAVWRFTVSGRGAPGAYRQFRQDIGRGILLGLEFLVAADIVRTVAVAPTLNGVLVLGLIVLIRTFLSVALEVELEGRWPWQPRTAPSADQPPGRR